MRGAIRLACIATLLGPAVDAQPPPAPPPLAAILGDAAAYIDRFVERFSSVVTEEHYVQEIFAAGNAFSRESRELRSDFLLVKPTQAVEWMPFRDVFAVDGAAVRDRQQRLIRLFVDPAAAATAIQQAALIADEGARFNLGNMRRTVNNPVMALAFLQGTTQKRFRYTLGDRDPREGESVWIVEAREQTRPTLIKGANDRDLPVEARYWIDAATGRVTRTVFLLGDTSVNAQVTTTFRMDERFGIAVPAEMTETYLMRASGGRLLGRASYGRFRRFDVTATETIEAPRPDRR